MKGILATPPKAKGVALGGVARIPMNLTPSLVPKILELDDPNARYL